MTIKKSGFTIFEIIVMMFILVAVSAVFMKWTSNRQLLNSSKIYADQSYNYAMMYIKYLQDNESEIQALQDNPSIIPFTNLVESGYVDVNTSSTNIYGQTPCVIVTKSSSNQLYPILIFNSISII